MLPESRPLAYLGIDFGTTNTLVYYQKAETDRSSPPPVEQPLRPDGFRHVVQWIHPASPADLEAPGWFLPQTPVSDADPYLIPSAVWSLPGVSKFWPIRWSSHIPARGARAFHGFKWATPDTAEDEAREQFLRELLFLCIPYALREMGLANSSVKLNLGLACPLAFGDTLKRRMADLFQKLECELERMGIDAKDYWIDESLACVRAFGAARPNETFLVADMGGGTMDVALFRFQLESQEQSEGESDRVHQIGSVRFGAETYVTCIADRKSRGMGDAEERENNYWEFRESIVKGTVGRRYPSDDLIQRLADRFQIMALEFLRTMLAANRYGETQSEIKVLLVGNGWRLCELASGSEQRSSRQIFLDYFCQRIGSFELASVLLDERLFEQSNLPSESVQHSVRG